MSTYRWLYWVGALCLLLGFFALPGAQFYWGLNTSTESTIFAMGSTLLGIVGGSALVNAWILRH